MPTATKSPGVTRWMRLLRKEGYRPDHQVNTESPRLSRIQFKVEGRVFDVYLDDDDPGYSQLSLEYGLREGAGDQDLAPLGIANGINARLKVVKCAVDLKARTVAFNVESFASALPDAESFGRWIFQTRSAAKEFFDELDVERPRALA